MYNLGLGIILKKQSSSGFLTQFVKNERNMLFSTRNQWLSYALSMSMPDKSDILNDHKVPSAFPAWILFRSITNLVEFNDVFAFTVMAVQYGSTDRWLPEGNNVLWTFADLLGGLLIGFSLYSKLEAHRTAGDFAWFWGDFFFLRTGERTLSFEGVFELFPHPMYTIGYGWTYGCAILARSFTVLACVLVFHFSQLLFLVIVESPHVELLYGKDNSQILASGRFLPRLPSFDIFNGYDVNLVLMNCFFVLGIRFGSSPHGPLDDDAFFLANAVFWRALAFSVEASILVRQERSKFWTKRFLSKGHTKVEAFDSWKRLVTVFSSLQYISFVLAALRVMWFPDTWWGMCSNAQFISQIMLSFILFMVSLWSNISCFEVLGSYGWFFGDFFLAPAADDDRCVGRTSASKAFENLQPVYHGIYRYLNNPETYLGHLWLYGVALFCSSWDLFLVAGMSHAIKIAFLQAVEKPHVRSVYKQHVRQYSSVMERVVKGKVSDLKRNETALFLANWVKHPIETGALAPSSRQLACAMCDTMYFANDAVVLELGPGTGPFTREILKRLEPFKDTTFIGFELNEQFVDILRTLFPDNAECFIQESAERIMPVLATKGVTCADTIISGLPWAIFPDSLQRAILTEVYASLRPGGRFCTFAYLQGLVLPAGQNFKALLDSIFDKVERSPVVWKNFPPAFVYRCEKLFEY